MIAALVTAAAFLVAMIPLLVQTRRRLAREKADRQRQHNQTTEGKS